MEYEEYVKKSESFEKTNNSLLKIFEEDLIESGLKEKTIYRHLSNVNFFLNDFLAFRMVLPMKEGIYNLDEYLGYFFIRKCMWSTPANIKTTAASIKKFYKCMLNHEKIKKEDYDYLCTNIKDFMEYWQETCAQYNDPDSPNPFFDFL